MMDNDTIAQRLNNYADYLEARDANPFRVQAYRRAAQTVLGLARPVADLVAEQGRAGLEALPGIGPHLSCTLAALAQEGEFRTRNREGGQIDPRRLFGSLPGVGPHLALQIHEQLGIETLEELERAAHDGRLGQLGVGRKRLRGIIDSLAGRLGRRRRTEAPPQREPTVADLLTIDEEYRERSQASDLPTLAPRRFNPEGEAWLPLYRTNRNGWDYRALFYNTARAHQMGRTRDWVVIYFDDKSTAGQRTVVTETRGDLRGRRVVRGREMECREHYRAAGQAPDTAAAVA